MNSQITSISQYIQFCIVQHSGTETPLAYQSSIRNHWKSPTRPLISIPLSKTNARLSNKRLRLQLQSLAAILVEQSKDIMNVLNHHLGDRERRKGRNAKLRMSSNETYNSICPVPRGWRMSRLTFCHQLKFTWRRNSPTNSIAVVCPFIPIEKRTIESYKVHTLFPFPNTEWSSAVLFGRWRSSLMVVTPTSHQPGGASGGDLQMKMKRLS